MPGACFFNGRIYSYVERNDGADGDFAQKLNTEKANLSAKSTEDDSKGEALEKKRLGAFQYFLLSSPGEAKSVQGA